VMSVSISALKRILNSSLPLVVCMCLRLMVPNNIVLCYCLMYCVPYIAVSLDCQLLIAPSVFSNVYLPPVNTDDSLKFLIYDNKTFT